MRHITVFLLGSLVLLCSCAVAKGQGCSATLQPHFSVYNSVSRDGKTIYTSVTMQGYASICGPCGCPQMKSATHHVGAENKLNNVDHWTYSANGCPTCYFSATDNEQLIGVPGDDYPWDWEGVSICSIVGTFFGSGSGGSLPGCLVPSTETTAVNGTVDSTETKFTVTVSDSAGDSFSGQYVQEANASTGQDSCWFQGSFYAPSTSVVIDPPAAISAANQFSDTVGWIPDAVNYYRANAPLHGKSIPCGATLHQALQIMCNANTWWTYTPVNGNTLTATINQSNVVNCRYDMNNSACQTITY